MLSGGKSDIWVTANVKNNTTKEEFEMVFAKIAEVIADHIGGDVAEVTEETTFEDLGVDSLDTVEMVMRLEEELGVELELEGKFDTVGELAKFIESKIS